jgi:hypothetical protein
MTTLSNIRAIYADHIETYNASRSDEFYEGPACPTLTQGQRGAFIGALNRELGGDMNRKQFLKALTGYASSKDLTDTEWYALGKLLDFGADGKWGLSPDGADLARKIVAEHVQSDGQIPMF